MTLQELDLRDAVLARKKAAAEELERKKAEKEARVEAGEEEEDEDEGV